MPVLIAPHPHPHIWNFHVPWALNTRNTVFLFVLICRIRNHKFNKLLIFWYSKKNWYPQIKYFHSLLIYWLRYHIAMVTLSICIQEYPQHFSVEICTFLIVTKTNQQTCVKVKISASVTELFLSFYGNKKQTYKLC